MSSNKKPKLAAFKAVKLTIEMYQKVAETSLRLGIKDSQLIRNAIEDYLNQTTQEKIK